MSETRVRRRVVVAVAAAGLVAAGLVAGALGVGPLAGSAAAEPLSGTVEATEADLGFTVPGRIARVDVREGAHVQEGDVLAVLDTADLAAALAAAVAGRDAQQARLREAERGPRGEQRASLQAALRAAEQRAAEAVREEARARRLHEGGAISAQRLEQATTTAAVAAAARDQALEAVQMASAGATVDELEQVRATTRQADAAVARARAALDGAILRAPMAGVITLRHREPGEIVAAGMPVLSVQDPGDRWVRVYVPEPRMPSIRLGDTVVLRPADDPSTDLTGTIVFVGTEAEFTPRNVQTDEERAKLVYPVRVRIERDADQRLKPGLPADVLIHVGER